MSSTDETSTPGATTDVENSIFETTAEVERSFLDQVRQGIDQNVVAPMAIIWGDIRGKIGLSIVFMFIFMGTVGLTIVPEPQSLRNPIFATPFHDGWLTFGTLSLLSFDVPIVPEFHYPLGTDIQGQSILAQLVHATPAMLELILAGAVLSTFLGTSIGGLAGYLGGRVDRALMTVSDTVLGIPGIALVIVLASVFPIRDPMVVGLILGIDNWPGLARTIRSQVLSLREESYVEAARVIGVGRISIVRKHILSQMMPYISVNFAGSARGIIAESVALYFLGILPFSTLNWGVMMNLAYEQTSLTNLGRLHWLVLPMILLMLVSLGLILLSQAMDRVFNVRLRAKHASSVGGDEEVSVNETA
ncbi:ABC transporter permease [Halococcus agarilyticus]|uniref:ABC transporter permease n=1 Tax=Halococcus agarilyticus TaxID=1232219 RepID=UPI0006777438|nr:ABC transporter permease [Halococcus agarilyticus]